MSTNAETDSKSTVLLTTQIARTHIDRINRRMWSDIDLLRSEAEKLPEGKLYIKYRGNLVLFNKRSEGKTCGITRNRDLVNELARRNYLDLLLEMMVQVLEEGWTTETKRIIERLYPEIEELLQKYEEAGLDLDLITMTPDQRVWNSDRHSKSNYRREDLKYPTRRGRVYMRSKSEQLIGNLLEELHIPYRYEPEVTVNNRTYHPDFVIMLPNGRLVVLEHAGRMDLQEYREMLIQRLQAYDSIGLLIGRNVFISFEHDTRDEALIKEVIFQMLTADPMKNRILQSAAIRVGCNFEVA